ADGLGEALAGLAQGEVERRTLVGPAPPRFLDLERVRVRRERPRAGKRQDRACLLLAVVVLRVPGHVLAEPFLPSRWEVHERRHPRESARDRLLQPLEGVTLDLERKICEALP